MFSFDNYPNLRANLDEFLSGKLYEPAIIREARADYANVLVHNIIDDIVKDEQILSFCEKRFTEHLSKHSYSHGFPVKDMNDLITSFWESFSVLDKINFVFRNCDSWLPNCAQLHNYIVNYIHKHIHAIPNEFNDLFLYKSRQPWEHVNSYSREHEYRLIWDGVFNKCKKNNSSLLKSVEKLYSYLRGLRIDDLVDTDLIREHYNPRF